jgi:hypothetical protein
LEPNFNRTKKKDVLENNVEDGPAGDNIKDLIREWDSGTVIHNGHHRFVAADATGNIDKLTAEEVDESEPYMWADWAALKFRKE